MTLFKIDRVTSLALFLREHPHLSVEDDKKLFWFDPQQKKYYYHSLVNKVRNGVYEARGLMCAYNSFMKKGENNEQR